MISFHDLRQIEKDSINALIESTSVETRHAIYVWFSPQELRAFFETYSELHINRVIEFLFSNEFIKLRNYKPEYELMVEGRRLFKIGSIENYYGSMENNKSLNIVGSNNIVNVTHTGDIAQSAVNLNGEEQKSQLLKHSVSRIINPQVSSQSCSCPEYHHWVSRITLNGLKLSAQTLYSKLQDYRQNEVPKSSYKGQFLFLLRNAHCIAQSRNGILFQLPLKDAGVTNHFREQAIRITQNTIEYEFAQYKSNSPLVTDLNEEFMPLLTMLYFCNSLYPEGKMNVDVSVTIATNKDIQFMYSPQSVFSVEGLKTSSYLFAEGEELIERKLADISNESMFDLMRAIVELFVASSPRSQIPFLKIDENNQELVLNYVKSAMNITT